MIPKSGKACNAVAVSFVSTIVTTNTADVTFCYGVVKYALFGAGINLTAQYFI
jgi:hypothetical protein